jgi:hypothetical protein
MKRMGFATLFAAAAALTMITIQPVLADEATNGIRLNGEASNGIRLNGIRLNGDAENGIRLNGQSDTGTAPSQGATDAPNSPLDATTVQSIAKPDTKH